MRIGGLNFGGPVMWFLLFLIVLAFAGAIYMAIDLARRKDRYFDRWGRVVWMPIPLLFVFAVLAAFIGYYVKFHPVLSAGYGMVLFALVIANLVQLPAYLLRVVFPTPARAVKLAEMHDVEPPEWALEALGDQAPKPEGQPGAEGAVAPEASISAEADVARGEAADPDAPVETATLEDDPRTVQERS